MDYKIELLNYHDLRKGLSFDRDKYNVMSYQYETRRKTLLANPNLTDDSSPYMVIGVAENTIVGRTTLFPTKFKAGDQIFEAANGTSFHVEKEYRKEGIGADIFLTQLKKCGVDVKISANISVMALPINRATKNIIFQFPKFWQIRNTQSILRGMGFSGLGGRLLMHILNPILSLFCKCQQTRCSKKTKGYEISKVTTVPAWVNDIVLNDGHKYMEVHDHNWLQWNLNNNFCGGKDNIQSFFIITYNEKPVGFFMLKQRRYQSMWRMKDATVVSLVEWGVVKDGNLNEREIIYLASNELPRCVDIFEFATTDTELAKFFTQRRYKRMEDANVSIKDIKKQFPDFNNIELWRLRLGYADVILST